MTRSNWGDATPNREPTSWSTSTSARRRKSRRTFAELVTRIAERINIPFTVGGGIASVEDAGRLLAAGADKVTVNSAAVRNPELISNIASKYGSQFVVVAIDAKQADGRWRVTTHGGRRLTDRELFSWAAEAQTGAERARFCSRRWTTTGRKTATRATPTPGCRSGCRFPSSPRAEPDRYGTSPMCRRCGKADAALAASIFHYGEIPIPSLKRQLYEQHITVRL